MNIQRYVYSLIGNETNTASCLLTCQAQCNDDHLSLALRRLTRSLGLSLDIARQRLLKTPSCQRRRCTPGTSRLSEPSTSLDVLPDDLVAVAVVDGFVRVDALAGALAGAVGPAVDGGVDAGGCQGQQQDRRPDEVEHGRGWKRCSESEDQSIRQLRSALYQYRLCSGLSFEVALSKHKAVPNLCTCANEPNRAPKWAIHALAIPVRCRHGVTSGAALGSSTSAESYLPAGKSQRSVRRKPMDQPDAL